MKEAKYSISAMEHRHGLFYGTFTATEQGLNDLLNMIFDSDYSARVMKEIDEDEGAECVHDDDR